MQQPKRGVYMNSTGQMSDPERLVGILGILGLVGYCVYCFFHNLKTVLSRPLPPDPRDEQITADLAEGKGTPICHRCLAPHDPLADFCPDCGASVGKYTNWLPYPYVFALGHALRIGTSGTFRRSPLIIAGFILLAVVEYAVFAPFYWLRFFLNLANTPRSAPPAHEISGGES